MKEKLKHIAVIACLLPLLFLNIKDSHDWGDDFAQYLIEAKNILEHRPLGENNFIANPNFVLGPNCYPPGFPLIVALSSPLTDMGMCGLNVLISFFLLLIGYFSFLLLCKWFHFMPAIVFSLIIVYNPLVLQLKNGVLSDYPFTAMLLLFFLIYLFEDKKRSHFILLGFILAFAVNTRVVGWILVSAVIAETVYKLFIRYYRQKQFDKPYMMNKLYLLISFAVFHLLFYVIFPQSIIYYDNPVQVPFFDRLILNANYNYGALKHFFSCYDEGFLNVLISYGVVFTALIGMFIFIFKPDSLKPTILLFFFLGYVLSILIHQYSDTGIRLVIPIITIVLFFALYALMLFLSHVPYREYIAFCLGLIVLLCYKQNSSIILKSKHEIPGPYGTEAALTFDFINKNASHKDVILFSKPRALTYFTGKKTTINSEERSRDFIKEELAKIDPAFVLINKEITDDSTKTYFSRPLKEWKEVYTSENFKLYKNLLHSHN
jgi:hypothetical protein